MKKKELKKRIVELEDINKSLKKKKIISEREVITIDTNTALK